MTEEPYGHRQRWQQQKYSRQPDAIHVLHVLTDEGIEGMCTVGDARYYEYFPGGTRDDLDREIGLMNLPLPH